MELAPFPCGRLPGFHRAIPSTPLDAYCYVLAAVYPSGDRPIRPRRRTRAARNDTCLVVFSIAMTSATTDPLQRLEAILDLEEGAAPSPADAGDRQPLRDDRLRPAEEPRRLRAARPLRGPRRRHRGPRPRHRAVPRGRQRGLRRGRRVRRRRHRQRGRQRPGRLATRRCAACPAAAPTSTAGCSGSPPTSSTRPSTCSALAHDWRPRRVDVGRVNDRYFLFSAGVGLDASVVEQVDAHPRLKARVGEWYYTLDRGQDLQPPLPDPPAADARSSSASETRQRRHRDRPERRALHLLRRPAGAHGRGRQRSTAAIWPGVVLRRASPLDIPTISWRALSRSARAELGTARSTASAESSGCASARSTSARCRCRSTATTSARPTRRPSSACPGRCSSSSRWPGAWPR